MRGSGPLSLETEIVLARLKEFFHEESNWSRKLWDAGTVMSLRELHDAVHWSDRAVLSSSAVKWLARDVERLAGRDAGVGERVTRQQLNQVLRSSLTNGSHSHRALARLTDVIETGYLTRWRDMAITKPVAPERIARAIGSHLLDRGFSTLFLLTWVKSMHKQVLNTADVAEAARMLTEIEEKEFEILIPVERVKDPENNLDNDPAWRNAPSAARWMKANRIHDTSRQGGALVYKVKALDPFAAAEMASQFVERIRARLAYSRRHAQLVTIGHVWVAGDAVQHSLDRPGRGAHILSLSTAKRLFDVRDRAELNNALELASPLTNGAPGPAVSGGWSAIEGLLLSPTDTGEHGGRGVTAADRMAALIACSWPRSELTTLSWSHKPDTSDRLAAELALARTNRDRSLAVSEAIRSGRNLHLREMKTRAALSRMRQLHDHPRQTMGDIEAHMVTAMRRFYRHRNLLMHGAATTVQTLPMALRTAAPLIGAGLDRIAHASLTQDTDAMTLATHARLSLDLLSSSEAGQLVDLLE